MSLAVDDRVGSVFWFNPLNSDIDDVADDDDYDDNNILIHLDLDDDDDDDANDNIDLILLQFMSTIMINFLF